ncbi:hypothetical protein Ocin01_08880 [Orchesella cincta]|uniref:F-box domain-containing protein n=1 Tax=Orchesella cincta TaxID=48709 RepID=A0A1D2MXY1_ORCCI|nr:hypothetical protein Ocin01_08880 [Orchesella cincta]
MVFTLIWLRPDYNAGKKGKILRKSSSHEQSSSCVFPPAGWHELPEEVLEMILGKLPRDDKSHYLKCRCVNSTWKRAVDGILERTLVSTWGKWEPAETLVENTLEPFPFMSIVSAGAGTDLNFLFCPVGIMNWVGNPFPTSSLTICNKSLWKNYMMRHRENWMKIDKFFAEFGSCLTSLVLQDVTVSISKLKLILEKTVNLKALILKKVSFEKTDKQSLSSPVVFSSKLAHFRADQLCNPEAVQWLVNTFGHQLKTLEVRGHTLQPFQLPNNVQNQKRAAAAENGDKTRPGYQDLKQFKIFSPTKSFLQLTHTFPLHCLSISHIRRSQHINLKDLIDFIDKFSDSLLFLHLDINFVHELDMKVRPTDNPRSLSKLCKFDVRYQKTSEALLLIKSLFLPKFPNLKCLRFLFRYDKSIDYHGNFDDIKKSLCKFIEVEKFGEICPKLENVYVDRFQSPVLRANKNA